MTKTGEETLQLKKRIKELEEQLELKNKLVFMLDESIPAEQSERKKYMADCAIFYGAVFKKKIEHFIGQQLEELVQIGRTELGSNIIRSNVNCFRLMDEWLEKMTNEHFGNLQEIRNAIGTDFISNIKDKYDNDNTNE